MAEIKAECTWGNGPDVLVHSKDIAILLMTDPDKSRTKHGIVLDWQLDLTKDEANKLIMQLSNAVRICNELTFISLAQDSSKKGD